jgi:starch-binding outer membrane protein, SusD/RagB family
MRSLTRKGVLTLVALAAIGCNSLEVENPNAPDSARALTDPDAIEAIAGGTLINFFNTYNGLNAVGALTTQAQSHTASWNNFNMNFYSSVDADGTRNSRPWQNSPSAAGRTTIEWFWQGYYGVAAASRDALTAIRTNELVIGDAGRTARAEAIAELMLGAALGQIALNYDKGYFVDENTNLATLTYIDRKALRDSAILKLQSAATIAAANAFTVPDAWTGGGGSYDNTTIEKLANSLAAMTLAYWPRTDGENASVNWANVATFAANGLNADFVFVGDGCASVCPDMQSWTNDIFGIRVHTRVANLLDPVTQATPYPASPGGNDQPNSADARLGDGSFGTAGMEEDYGTVAKTANAGTDFAWSAYDAFFDSRGRYHQSAIGHIRWDESGTQSLTAIYYAYGPVPLIMKAQNDLIRAEALVRTNTNLALAATLINNTRVGRGALSPAAAGGDGPVLLKRYIDYENEIELLSQGASTFYNRRRVPSGLLIGTPREMPVPAKELGVKNEALYTWGGSGDANSPTPP